MCVFGNDIYEYKNVSQGKTTIPNVDDGDELIGTDVSKLIRRIFSHSGSQKKSL
jgi:hypothetical protein